jgi:hypothetical protein
MSDQYLKKQETEMDLGDSSALLSLIFFIYVVLGPALGLGRLPRSELFFL